MALYNYLLNSGVIVPDTSEILTAVQNEYIASFGTGLNVNPETPQGVLINAEALARTAVAENNAALANQINPNLAGGVFLDAIAALSGLYRTAATYSTVIGTVAGAPGTVIPTSASASIATGELFNPVETVTIGPEGNATVTFQCQVPGPIAVAIGALNTIAIGVAGWDTVTNLGVAILGVNVLSDLQFRRLRQDTLSLQGVSLPEAITSALLASDVTSLTFRENTTNTSQTIDGVTLVAHSIYVCATNNQPLTNMQIVASLTGTPGTVIPLTVRVSDGTNIYGPVEAGLVIPSGGTLLQVFQAVSPGAINTAPGTLTTIVTGTSGLVSVTNTYASFGYDYNFLYDTAQILLAKKSGGCAWATGPGTAPYGPQNIEVLEPTSGQLYLVNFDVPTPVLISININVLVTPGFVGNPAEAVTNAILAYTQNGNAQDPGWIVGADASCWELATAVNLVVPGVFIQSVEISDGSGFSTNTIAIDVWEQAYTLGGNILVLATFPSGLLVSR